MSLLLANMYTVHGTQCSMVCYTAYRHCLLVNVYMHTIHCSIVSSTQTHFIPLFDTYARVRSSSKIYTIFKFVVKFLFTSACGFLFSGSDVIRKCHNTFSEHPLKAPHATHLMTFRVVEYVYTNDGLPIAHMFDLFPCTCDTTYLV